MQKGFTEIVRVLRVHTQISSFELDIKRVIWIRSRVVWVVDEKGLDKGRYFFFDPIPSAHLITGVCDKNVKKHGVTDLVEINDK
jgi:hypothetical protein